MVEELGGRLLRLGKKSGWGLAWKLHVGNRGKKGEGWDEDDRAGGGGVWCQQWRGRGGRSGACHVKQGKSGHAGHGCCGLGPIGTWQFCN
jgi:hypothetical protein